MSDILMQYKNVYINIFIIYTDHRNVKKTHNIL